VIIGGQRFGGLLGPGDEGLAPNYLLKVGAKAIDVGVQSLIEKVEYESADGLADILKIYAKNPDFKLSDSKVFAPGNEVSVWMGYGESLRHIGRVKIFKNTPSFPADGFMTFEATGYTRDHEMMHKAPEASARAKARKGKGKQKGGRRFKNIRYSEAVEERAKDYGFKTDVDQSPDTPSDFIQKVGMSDYDFVQGLANLTGFYFWVDGDEKGKWTLHFKDPEKWDGGQERKFKFEYNIGDMSTLFTFNPELLVSEAAARIRARVVDPITGRVLEAEFSDDASRDTPELILEALSPDPSGQTIDKTADSSTAIQIFIGDYSFSDVANRRFKTEAEVIRWARMWFRKNRQNHILSSATTIGVEDIMARQIHTLEGVGVVYSGDYWMSRVKHTMDSGSGYTLDFSCRKQVPPPAGGGLLTGIL
jgi:phage protein D